MPKVVQWKVSLSTAAVSAPRVELWVDVMSVQSVGFILQHGGNAGRVPEQSVIFMQGVCVHCRCRTYNINCIYIYKYYNESKSVCLSVFVASYKLNALFVYMTNLKIPNLNLYSLVYH